MPKNPFRKEVKWINPKDFRLNADDRDNLWRTLRTKPTKASALADIIQYAVGVYHLNSQLIRDHRNLSQVRTSLEKAHAAALDLIRHLSETGRLGEFRLIREMKATPLMAKYGSPADYVQGLVEFTEALKHAQEDAAHFCKFNYDGKRALGHENALCLTAMVLVAYEELLGKKATISNDGELGRIMRTVLGIVDYRNARGSALADMRPMIRSARQVIEDYKDIARIAPYLVEYIDKSAPLYEQLREYCIPSELFKADWDEIGE